MATKKPTNENTTLGKGGQTSENWKYTEPSIV